MKLLQWWVARADRGDVYSLPPWGYDEVVRSRWERGLLELRVKKLTEAEQRLTRENGELRREVERLGGNFGARESDASPFGPIELHEDQLELTEDEDPPEESSDPWVDAAAESMRSRFRRSRELPSVPPLPDTAEAAEAAEAGGG
jgi:hypothetical protein